MRCSLCFTKKILITIAIKSAFYSLDELVLEDHLLRQIDHIIDFSFIYDLVKDSYCLDNGRPSLDPILLVKLPIIQFLFGIRSLRQTIKEIEDKHYLPRSIG